MRERFDELRAMGIRTVMITGDNAVTATAIAAEAGVDDVLAEATPEDKIALIRKEQEGGRMVAMCGDGTNDAPGAGPGRRRGRDEHRDRRRQGGRQHGRPRLRPDQALDVVEIGKQLLITRGALTTFSVANDVAKYFAILPAMFVVAFPGLDVLNVMRLSSPGVGDPLRRGVQRAGHRARSSRWPCAASVPAVVGRRAAAPQPAASTASVAWSPRSSASSCSTSSSPSSPASERPT